MHALLSPRSVAVVGVSTRDSAGNRVFRGLRDGGFPGEIHQINPKYAELNGAPCHPSLAALPAPPDAVFIAVAAANVEAVLRDAADTGVKAAIVNASGFSDAGAEGLARQDRLAAIAREAGMVLCGPNNMGLANVAGNVILWTGRSPLRPARGPIALVSQSGSVAIALSTEPRGGFSHIITVGNEAVSTLADYVDALVDDDNAGVIALYIETIRDPRRFAAAALRAAERGKPVIVLKAGRSAQGGAMVASHSGALAGEDATYEAFFAHLGIMRAADMDELMELAILCAAHPEPPAAPGVAAVTVSGGEGALLADLAEAAGLALPPLSPAAKAQVRDLYPATARDNPVDAYGLGWDGSLFGTLLETLMTEPGVGTILAAVDAPGTDPNGGRTAIDIAATYGAFLRAGKVPEGTRLVLANNTAPCGPNPKVKALLDEAGLPYLAGMRTALGALSPWSRRRPAPALARSPAAASAPNLLEAGEAERYALLGEAGVPMAPTRVAASEAAALAIADELGYPVVLKGLLAAMPHKSEHGLVHLALADADALSRAYRETAATLSRYAGASDAGEIVVQPMTGKAVQLYVGARHAGEFGVTIIVGVGGVLVELLNDVSVRIGPVDEASAHEMLAETTAGRLLAGVRGAPPSDVAAAAAAIARFSELTAGMGADIAAVEINPLMVLERGHGVVGVDLVVERAAGAAAG